MRAVDPKLTALMAVIEQWKIHIGDKRVTAKEAIAVACNQAMPGCIYPPAQFSDFYDALLAVAGERGAVDARRLGIWLQANRGRLVGDHKFVDGGMRSGTKMWRLVEATNPKMGGDAARPRPASSS